MKKVLMLFIILSGGVFAAERSRPYDNVNEILSIINTEARSPYIALSASLNIEKEGIDYSDLKLWITDNGKKIADITVSATGEMDLPFLDEAVGKRALLHINQGKGVVSMSLGAAIRPPKEKEVSYQSMFLVLKDIKRITKEKVGMAAWLLPTFDRLVFKFEQAATISMPIKGKDTRFKSNDDHEITLKIKDSIFEKNPTMTFSHLPIEIEPKD